VSTEQVREVRGLPDSVYQKIKPYITISTLLLRRLNINTASVEELEQHPYLNRQQAKAIVEYRSRKGTFQQIEVLQVIDVLNDEKQTFVRIKPYLSL
jgi:competence ComEA-like helix-hairpin-helix protein